MDAKTEHVYLIFGKFTSDNVASDFIESVSPDDLIVVDDIEYAAHCSVLDNRSMHTHRVMHSDTYHSLINDTGYDLADIEEVVYAKDYAMREYDCMSCHDQGCFRCMSTMQLQD